MAKKQSSDAIEGIKSGVQLGVTHFAIPAVDLFVATNPDWLVPWVLAKGFFGILFGFQQEKINWFVQYLESNRGEFAQEVVKTDEFQEGFVITFENYIRQRGEERRKIIEQIFIDFTKEVDKKSFELERLYRTSELISLESVRFLGFLQSTIWPTLTSDITEGIAVKAKLTEILGDFFRKEGNDAKYPDFYQNYIEHLSELNALGLITSRGYKTATYSGETNIIYGFTEFGLRFIKYVMNL